ncbi:unnamed protein product [Orchesella dallaii]|uniref:Uncharacterized protein n=1 Tax=Orchesella dallaii TaxID=48710 RepID=A0ABP1PU34_9HEXA
MKFVPGVLSAVLFLVHCAQPAYCLLQLNGCPDFEDLREESRQNQTQWGIMSLGNTTSYKIIQPEVNVLSSCSETVTRYFIVDNSRKEKLATTRQIFPRVDELPSPDAFTLKAEYFDGFHYFQRSEYCVNAFMDFAISLRVCQPICNSFYSGSKVRLCIPKCCAPDEVLGYWSYRCVRLHQQEPKWQPVVCKGENCTQVDPSETIHYYRHTLPCIRNSMRRHPLRSIELLVADAKAKEEKEK